MTLDKAQKLEIGDEIDWRDANGFWAPRQIVKKKNDILSVDDDPYGLDENQVQRTYGVENKININKSLDRIAAKKSISSRVAHRLNHLSSGDMVDLNPWSRARIKANLKWRVGKVERWHGGQILCSYIGDDGETAYYWVHADDTQEIVRHEKWRNINIV